MHIIFFFHVCLFKQIFSVLVNQSNKTKKGRKTESKTNGDEDDKKEQEKPTFSDNEQYCIIPNLKNNGIILIFIPAKDSVCIDLTKLVEDIKVKKITKHYGDESVYLSL